MSVEGQSIMLWQVALLSDGAPVCIFSAGVRRRCVGKTADNRLVRGCVVVQCLSMGGVTSAFVSILSL